MVSAGRPLKALCKVACRVAVRDMAIFTVITISTVRSHGSTYFTLDVNSIIVKRISRTFGKYTRQLSRLRTAAMSNVHAILLQSVVNLLQAKQRTR